MTVVVVGLSPNDPLSLAVSLMRSKKRSCVLVSEDGFPKGILSERDALYLYADAVNNKSYNDCTLAEVMTTEPVCVRADTPLYDALVLARSRKLRHLVVVDDSEKLAGLITQTDMVDAYFQLMERQEELETENHKLHLLSHKDALMGIGNRRAMEVELNYTESSSLRYDKNYAIALIDVDYFKNYNDHYGHRKGDEALAMMARAIESSMRDSDRLYRYGGEELLLLMAEASEQDAIVASERTRRAVENMQLEHTKSPYGILTVSVGVAAGRACEWKGLVDRADKALYRAKEAGRNSLEVASQELVTA